MTNTASIKDSIEILKRAQTLDREIYLGGRESQEIPELKEKLKQEFESHKEHLKQLEGDFRKLQMKQKEKDGELQQKEANVKKLDGQLGAVKTNKEYAALQQEIASLKADGSLLEEEIIKVMDQVEAAELEMKKEKDRLKTIEKDFQAREGELDQRLKAITDKVEGLKKERETITQQVAPDVRGLYDLIIQKKQGVALAKISNDICGACQLQLRPQLINEVRMYQALVVCENCSRILYTEEQQ